MSGWDYLAVILLAGFLIVTVAFDQLRARRGRNINDDYDQRSHHALMREIRRQP